MDGQQNLLCFLWILIERLVMGNIGVKGTWKSGGGGRGFKATFIVLILKRNDLETSNGFKAT